MTRQVESRTTPARILLATDLGARCDRALDRAVELARAWGAELFAVHALRADLLLEDPSAPPQPCSVPPSLQASLHGSWPREPDALAVATDALQRDLEGTPFPILPLVVPGEPAPVILAAAEEHRCDLIVIAVAKDEALGGFLLGATVDKVLRQAKVPVLVVRQRPRHPYGGIVVAADVSPASRAALRRTVALFPGTPFHVFHAYDPPLGGLLTDAAEYRQAFGELAQRDLEAFLAEAEIGPGHVIDVLVERGDPARLIQHYVRSCRADLVVLGTEGRGPLLELLVGSTAKSVLDGLACDALVVPVAADA